MKKKILLVFLLTSACFQAQVTDFITGLDQPNRLIIDNNMIYVKGVATPGEIIQIDLNAPTPSANVLFNSLPASSDPLGIGNIAKQGDVIYLSYLNDNTGESTLASFDINSPTVLNDIVTGLGYVAALAIYNDELYFTNEDLSGGGTSLKKIDITISNPPVTTVLNGLTNPQDMEFNANMLYIGDRDAGGGSGIIYAVDVTSGTPMLDNFITNVNARGVHVYNDYLYFSAGGVIQKAPFADPSNITTEAIDNDGAPEFLRDVVISGTYLYMPQETSGKIVTKEDQTLSLGNVEIRNRDIAIYSKYDKVTFKGLSSAYSKIKLYNLNGQLVLHTIVNANDNSIDTSILSSGVYVLHLEGHKTYKIVK